MNPHWSNTDFITQCRIACKFTIENVNAGQWLKQALDRLEKAEAEITKIKTENKQLRKDWCDDDEAIKQQALRVLPKEIVEGDSFHVPRMGGLAELMADEIEKLKKENQQLRLGWCRESEKRQQDWFDPSKGPTCDRERFI